jgi:hypothetical protein
MNDASGTPTTDKGRSIIKMVEQKITEFFRVKTRPKPQTAPRPLDHQSQEPPTQDHRQHYTTRIYHFFRRRLPRTTRSNEMAGNG